MNQATNYSVVTNHNPIVNLKIWQLKIIIYDN